MDDLIIKDDAAYFRGSETISKRLVFKKEFAMDDGLGHHHFSDTTIAQFREYVRLLEEEKDAYLWWGSWADGSRGAETAIWTGFRQRRNSGAAGPLLMECVSMPGRSIVRFGKSYQI